MSAFEKLIEEFRHFPGTGPRQARRFVYYLLSRDQGARERIGSLIGDLSSEIGQCTFCRRFFRKNGDGTLCRVCADPNTDKGVLLVVEKDTDADNIEKTGAYKGRYFVLGGTVPILDQEPHKRIRARELLSAIDDGAKCGLTEIILAMSVNSEGENTGHYVAKILEPVIQKLGIKMTALGRGLSTGTELEYADAETFRAAFTHRG